MRHPYIQWVDGGVEYLCIRDDGCRSVPGRYEEVPVWELEGLLRRWASTGGGRHVARIAGILQGASVRCESSDASVVQRLVRSFSFGSHVVLRRITERGLPPAEPIVPINDLAHEDSLEEEHWVELQLFDEQDEPAPRVRCSVELPGGRVVTTQSNLHGVVRIDGIRNAGDCKVSFPPTGA